MSLTEGFTSSSEWLLFFLSFFLHLTKKYATFFFFLFQLFLFARTAEYIRCSYQNFWPFCLIRGKNPRCDKMVRNFGRRKPLFYSAVRAFLNFVNLISFHGIPYTSPYTKPYFYEAMIMELLRRNYGEAMDILWILSCWNRFVFCTLTAWLLHIYCIRTAEFGDWTVLLLGVETLWLLYSYSIDTL